MKIFPRQSTSEAAPAKTKASAKEGKVISRKKPEAPPKKELSADQIKEKLAAHVDTSETAKNMAVKNSKKLGDGFMNDSIRPEVVSVEAPLVKAEAAEEKPVNSKDLTLKSDIALNDPKDTNTQEKLKTVLSRGAFNFNSKERDALEKILAG